MTNEKRPVIIAGNWKMYKTIEEGVAFIKALAPLVQNCSSLIYLAVPFTAIEPLAIEAKKTNIRIGAQNMHDATQGAFTGEVAAPMLKDAGAKFVILGHSERRRFFNEDNAFINKKVKSALRVKLQPILCIGETQEERSAGNTEEVLSRQLKECLVSVTSKQFSTLIIAYEPVWAIGTDQAATPEIAQEVHHFIRQFIAQTWGEESAGLMPVLYGGSVKPENAKELLEQPDIDGLLVGGASLSVETFSKIVT